MYYHFPKLYSSTTSSKIENVLQGSKISFDILAILVFCINGLHVLFTKGGKATYRLSNNTSKRYRRERCASSNTGKAKK